MIIFQFLNSKNCLYILSFQLNMLECSSHGAHLSHSMFSDSAHSQHSHLEHFLPDPVDFYMSVSFVPSERQPLLYP